MKVSVITCCYNAAATIEMTLESVAIQTYHDIEHIIIDGNSSDETVKLCGNYSHISKLISEPDKGIYDAFNKGLKEASGDVVGYLNADDRFCDENALRYIVEGFE